MYMIHNIQGLFTVSLLTLIIAFSNIWLPFYHSKIYIHTYHNACKTMNGF